MLEFQVSQSPFRFGLQEGIEPHQVTPGTLLTADNAEFLKSGKVQKRAGTTELPIGIISGGTIPAGARIFARGNELCLIDGTSLYAYSATSGAWKTVGKIPNLGITSTTLSDSVAGVAAFDSAVSSGGLRVDAWVTTAGTTSNGALVLQVVDVASGALLVLPSLVVSGGSNCYGVRVVIIGTTAIVVTQKVASTTMTAVTVNLTTLALGTASLRTDVNAGPGLGGWDICVIGSNFVLAYTNTAVALKLYSYNTSLVQQATGGITSEATGADLVSIDGASGEALYVLYRKGALATPIKIAIANSSTLVETVATVAIESPAAILATQVAVCRYNSTNCIAAYTVADASGNARVTTYQVSSAAVVAATTERGTYGCAMLTRPFIFSNACYVALSEQTAGSASGVTDKTSTVVEVEITAKGSTYTPHRYIGAIDVLIGGTWNTNVPSSMSPLSSTSAVIPTPFQSSTNKAVVRQGVRLVTLAIGASMPVDMWRTYSPSQDVFLSGGALTAYDGRTAFDYGFPRGPVFISVTPAAGGAPGIAAGVYLYGGVLEYRSATGLLFRSPTQTVTGGATTVAAGGKVTIVADGYNLGSKQTVGTGFGTSSPLPSLLAWYRTVAGGSNYQRVTVEPTYNTTFVDQSVGSVSYVDQRPDTDITGVGPALAARPLLYTAGGILDDFAPPASVTMCNHVGRLWVLANDQKTWWYSKSFQDDLGTAPGFNPQFLVSFPDVQTAMASMDDKAIFFSATGVKYMLGTGPAPNGLNSDFQTPTTIQSDVGCTTARSVVTTPDGVMFLSERGIYLLTRGLELVWIGRQVKDEIAAYPVITSAVLVAKKNQVRFTCTDAAATVGVTLVYDYVEKQWTRFVHWINGVYGAPIADACMWNGAWTFLSSSGLVYTESATTFLDNGNYVPMTLETAWITAPGSQASPSSGPLKFQSVRTFTLHGFSNSDHDLTIQCGFDTDPSYPQSVTFVAGSPTTTIGTLEDCEVSIGTRRKCNAIRFKVSDATPSGGFSVGTGQGPSFDMMALEVGVKRGTGNTPATKRG